MKFSYCGLVIIVSALKLTEVSNYHVKKHWECADGYSCISTSSVRKEEKPQHSGSIVSVTDSK